MPDILEPRVAIALLLIGSVIGWMLASRDLGAPVPTSGFFKGTPSQAFRVAGCTFLILLGVTPLVFVADYFGLVTLALFLIWVVAFIMGIAAGAILHGH